MAQVAAGHQLFVRNFCCIKEATIRFRPVTIFIGPQASGKSLIAKLCYFFRHALAELPLDMTASVGLPGYLALLQQRFKRSFPPQTWGRKKFEIKYANEGLEILVSRSSTSQDIKIKFSTSIQVVIDRIEKEWAALKSRRQFAGILEFDPEYAGYVLRRALRRQVPASITTSLLFVPAGRSFFTNLDSAVWPILRKQGAIDPFLIEFGLQYQRAKSLLRYYKLPSTSKAANGKDRLEQQLWKVFGGDFKVKGDDESFQLEDGRNIPLANLSSGQQELLPLLLALRPVPGPYNEQIVPRAIFIEEPEAHLFPQAQKEVVEFVVAVFNAFSAKSQLVITTHSPYVLSTINNLIKAYSVAYRRPSIGRRAREIVPNSGWISFKSVAAYLVSDGSVTSILDPESSLIDQSFIDAISSDISSAFERLVELSELSKWKSARTK